jgi:hypothetical protein
MVGNYDKHYFICIDLIMTNFVLLLVPSGPPTNFTLSPLSSTSVQLSWDLPLPEYRNGIVRQYIIHVQLPVGEILSYATSSNSYAISGLRPYTTYFFSVAAVTVGEGPTTERIVAQTVTDGMGIATLFIRTNF